MNKKTVDLYDSHYGEMEADVYREIRQETYGDDLGQTSWMTAAECDEFCRWIGLRNGQRLLEIASGSGGTAAHIANRFGVSVVGIDINESAVQAAKTRTDVSQGSIEFQVADANNTLSFPEASFDAIFCNDSFNHLKDRVKALMECHRVLRPGGRFLYTDPTVLTGLLSNAEIEARSSIGYYTFTAPGCNETMINTAGFRLVLTADVTDSVYQTAQAWFQARSKRMQALCKLEGREKFQELQDFLTQVFTLADERRLSRFVFVCEKT